MINLLPWKRNGSKQADRLADMKSRIVKNEEVILEAMGKRIKGNKCCPYLLGAPCIADACHMWMEFKNVNTITGKELTYYDCSLKRESILLIELMRDVNLLRKELKDAAKPQS